MVMLYRKLVWQRGLAVLIGLACALGNGTATAQSDDGFVVRDWRVDLESRVLPDGSTLISYRAWTKARVGSDASMIVSFHPRFDCQPHFAVSVPSAPFAEAPVEDELLPISLDGGAVSWPMTVDAAEDNLILSLNAVADAQRALQGRIDLADRARLTFSDEYVIEYSLLGSRRTMAEARKRCQAHEPDEWVPNG